MTFSPLYPIQNAHRNVLDMSGIWRFQADSGDVGEAEGWFKGLPAARTIAVPGSWNEQHEDLRDYTDAAWYSVDVWVPAGWRGQRVLLRFGSANYFAKLWVNGDAVGEHEGGHLPFGFDITDHVRWDAPNHVVVRVDNSLKVDRLPPGGVGFGGSSSMLSGHPLTSYDFFPYAGLQRQVWLMGVPAVHIQDIETATSYVRVGGKVEATVTVKVTANSNYSGAGSVQIDDSRTVLDFVDGRANATVHLSDAVLWGPGQPNLYALRVSLGTVDSYTLDIGVRKFEVRGDRMFLNDAPITMQGFGKHEDFYGSGRGLNLPVLVKDHDLLRWVGANSYRTAHYPYSEEAMQMADRHGILVIDETPAVGLGFHMDPAVVKRHYALCAQATEALIARDKNHPCVIAWSIANEPVAGSFMNPAPEESEIAQLGLRFLADLVAVAKEHDPTRAVTFAALQGSSQQWLGLADFICVNRYYGWYRLGGRLDEAMIEFAHEMAAIHKRFGKPILVSEFGADTIAGMHAQPPEMFSEEYQAEVLKAHIDFADAHPFMAGLHVWNFADFKTAQGIIRMGGMNLKGVFTRDRRPKMAAHLLRSRWHKPGGS